jgi:hypothetical protein
MTEPCELSQETRHSTRRDFKASQLQYSPAAPASRSKKCPQFLPEFHCTSLQPFDYGITMVVQCTFFCVEECCPHNLTAMCQHCLPEHPASAPCTILQVLFLERITGTGLTCTNLQQILLVHDACYLHAPNYSSLCVSMHTLVASCPELWSGSSATMTTNQRAICSDGVHRKIS